MSEGRNEEARVIQHLQAAGWSTAEGAETLKRAYLTYDNGSMLIEVERDFQSPELRLTLADHVGREVTVFSVYGDSLDATLDAIVGFQDRVDHENFQDMLRELLRVCPETYIQVDEDEEPRLLSVD